MVRCLYILLFLLIPSALLAQENTEFSVPYSKIRLEQAIYKYENLVQANNWHTFPKNILIQPGDTNKYIPLLQENLILTGDLFLGSTTNNPVYTPEMVEGIKKFQKRHGLKDDGIVGPKTAAALNVPLTQRLRQLKQNLATWDTALAVAPQPYVIINLPEFTLRVVENDQTAMYMRVIVGKPSLPTYTLQSEVDMVVFHPYWYIPTSIAVDEIAPILQRNPGYLGKKNMKLERKTDFGWIRTNPWRVNWHVINRRNFNYRIVQLSGPDNELGNVKFPFPNRIPQYMHDTPSKALFEYPVRAFSHGCIRLEKPMEFAYYLLEKGSGFDTNKIDRLWLRNKPNHYIKVKDPLPLFIIYQTAWVDEHMQVQFRDDIYGKFDSPRLSKE